MYKFIKLSMVERSSRFNEDTGGNEVVETTKPVAVNATCIRCFYERRDNRPGTRITFNDGGGFAVSEGPDHVAILVAGGEVPALPAPGTH